MSVVRPIGEELFPIWNRDHEMTETDAGKLEFALCDFFNEEF
jgi:hypothetical protein